MGTSDWPPPQPPKRHLWAGPDEPEPAPSPPPPPAPPPPTRRRDLFPWIAGALAVAAIGATAGAIVSSRGDDTESTTSGTQTTPPPTTSSSTLPTAPTPPVNPRHVVRSAVVA